MKLIFQPQRFIDYILTEKLALNVVAKNLRITIIINISDYGRFSNLICGNLNVDILSHFRKISKANTGANRIPINFVSFRFFFLLLLQQTYLLFPVIQCIEKKTASILL